MAHIGQTLDEQVLVVLCAIQEHVLLGAHDDWADARDPKMAVLHWSCGMGPDIDKDGHKSGNSLLQVAFEHQQIWPLPNDRCEWDRLCKLRPSEICDLGW